MDKATPTPASVDKQAALVAKLRYMGKQYAAGQVARGGAPQKHYLEEAADEIEMMAWALSVNKVTPESAQENAALRNVIQAACIDGLPGLARAWAKYFPDRPITIKGAEVERLAAQAASAPAVRMLTEDELHMAWVSAGQSHTPARIADAVQREFCAVNAGKRIPASGEIGEQS